MTKQKVKYYDADFDEAAGVDRTYKVAVYGSLRKGLHNHHALDMDDEEFLGLFETPPLYSMYAVSSSFPGLKENGSTSIKMEVYEVSSEKLIDLNGLEGYNGPESLTNFYDRIEIDTPWGEAYTYIYNPSVSNSPLVESGDWKEYFEMRKMVNKK